MREERRHQRRRETILERLGSLLASRPKRAAVLFLTLVVAFFLVLAGLALELSDFGSAPYPSSDLPFSLVGAKVVYTEDSSYGYQDNASSALFPYTGMWIVFSVGSGGGTVTMPGVPFGNQSQMSTNSTATVHQVLMTSSWVNASIDITESTGDGSFDTGDSIVFDLVPLKEDMIFTIGLTRSQGSGGVAIEMSFAVHDGKLYAWNSQYLTGPAWYEPYIGIGS